MRSWKEINNEEREIKVGDNLNNISLSLQRILDMDNDFLTNYIGKSNVDFLRDTYYKIDSIIVDID